MNRRLTLLAVLGLSTAAVPTLAGAHSHYTGKVPPSVAMGPVDDVTVAPQPTPIMAPKRTTAKTSAKHAAHKKHHKRKRHATASA